MSKHTYFYLFILAIFLFLVSPFLLSEGMFIDGLFYATIARNLAEGIGTYWFPVFTATDFVQFHEHPPLAFWIQSIFFQIFGDSVYVEKLYSFATFLITAGIMVKIWHKITSDQIVHMAWLPLLFWVLCPLVFWAAPNNMLENTLMIFTTWAIYTLIFSLERWRVPYILLAAFLLFLACLTKGFVALFPWSFFFWVFLLKKDYRLGRFFSDTSLFIGATVALFVALFLLVPESYESLYIYFQKQVVGSIQNVQTVGTRFYIIWAVFLEFIPAGILMAIIWWSTFRKNFKKRNGKWGSVFLLLGLSAVLPMMISLKQRGFYILPSLPMFAIAFAYFVAPRVEYLTSRIKTSSLAFRIFKVSSILLLLGSILININQVNTIGRDHEKIADMKKVASVIPDSSIISIPEKLHVDYALIGYFYRYNYISLESQPSFARQYALVEKGYDGRIPEVYQKVDIDLNKYQLYRKRN